MPRFVSLFFLFSREFLVSAFGSALHRTKTLHSSLSARVCCSKVTTVNRRRAPAAFSLFVCAPVQKLCPPPRSIRPFRLRRIGRRAKHRIIRFNAIALELIRSHRPLPRGLLFVLALSFDALGVCLTVRGVCPMISSSLALRIISC